MNLDRMGSTSNLKNKRVLREKFLNSGPPACENENDTLLTGADVTKAKKVRCKECCWERFPSPTRMRAQDFFRLLRHNQSWFELRVYAMHHDHFTSNFYGFRYRGKTLELAERSAAFREYPVFVETISAALLNPPTLDQILDFVCQCVVFGCLLRKRRTSVEFLFCQDPWTCHGFQTRIICWRSSSFWASSLRTTPLSDDST